ncbi:MAG: hypothetical protein HY720_05315 [Planctomycetes bacterium]|nr:hypothetical protein [Planctomycetota bacterium]
MKEEKKKTDKKALFRGLYEFYKSFGTLNFTILLGIAVWMAARGMMERERLSDAWEALKAPKEEVPEPEKPADLEAWRDLETNEEREAFLERGYQRLTEWRAKWNAEREQEEGRLAADQASLEDLKKELDRTRADLEKAEKLFQVRQAAWGKEVEEEAFAAQVAVYMKMKEDSLAELLLMGKGEEGDRHIVRVLRAMGMADVKKPAKLLATMMASDLGGPARVKRIQEIWLAAQPETSPGTGTGTGLGK